MLRIGHLTQMAPLPVRGRNATSTLRGRSLSCPAKMKRLSEIEEIANRSGLLWEGIERRINLSGGYIYRLKLRDECDDVTPHADLEKRTEEAWRRYQLDPGEEPMGSYVDRVKKPLFKALEVLGYRYLASDQGVFMELPDQEAIEANWEEVRKERPELIELSLLGIEEEFGDLPFIDAFFTHHGFLSKRRLFIHDQVFHLMDILIYHLTETPEDRANLSTVKTVVAKLYRRIMIAKRVADNDDKYASIRSNLNKFVKILGIIVDQHTGCKESKLVKAVQLDCVEVWMNGYLDGCQSSKLYNGVPLIKLWKEMVAIEKQFDQNLNRYSSVKILSK